MSHGVCYVNWCPSLATGPDGACALHHKRPVLHSHETRDKWVKRIRAKEEAAKEKFRREHGAR